MPTINHSQLFFFFFLSIFRNWLIWICVGLWWLDQQEHYPHVHSPHLLIFGSAFHFLIDKTPACTEMLRWALGLESRIFSSGWHLNTPFFSSPVSGICLFFVFSSRQLDLCSVSISQFQYYNYKKCQYYKRGN